mmetsp:Transcript_9569/g.17459  ORF Transcript_9569/g.17459 Transcript_9569/m.17459 type:complete len:110 (-) Transcript_9569:2264-2593(-)
MERRSGSTSICSRGSSRKFYRLPNRHTRSHGQPSTQVIDQHTYQQSSCTFTIPLKGPICVSTHDLASHVLASHVLALYLSPHPKPQPRYTESNPLAGHGSPELRTNRQD